MTRRPRLEPVTQEPDDEKFEPCEGLENPSQSSQIETLIAEVQNLKSSELATRAAHRDLAMRYNRAVERIRKLENENADLRKRVSNRTKTTTKAAEVPATT